MFIINNTFYKYCNTLLINFSFDINSEMVVLPGSPPARAARDGEAPRPRRVGRHIPPPQRFNLRSGRRIGGKYNFR